MPPSLQLPNLVSVTLDDFSLYTLRPQLSVEVGGGVFCLAGANGLGKSSFIAALNYGLTGAVAPPRPRLDQLSKYVRDARAYSNTYFTGRISENNRATAAVSLDFSVGERQYSIKRHFFNPHELASLVIKDAHGVVVVEQNSTMDAEERQEQYEQHLVHDSGLQSFAQFLFLQHYVFTFDEWRHLLFWDDRASELVLFLALGLDPSLARRTDELRKQASAAGSNARNAQYQSTLSRNEIRRLSARLESEGGVPAPLLEDYSVLQTELGELSERRADAVVSLTDARLEFAKASAKQMSARQAYEEAFRRRLAARKRPGLSPLVAQTLADHRCRLCGTQHPDGPERIERMLALSQCPLCDAYFAAPDAAADPTSSAAELASLDADLAHATAAAAEVNRTVERLEDEHRSLQASISELRAKIGALEEEHDLSERMLVASEQTELVEQIKALRTAVDVALSRKDEQLQARSEALAELAPIQESLHRAWREAEISFVPRFRGLAEAFIGLPIHIDLDSGTSVTGTAHLVLTVNDSHRRKSEQLSESQRFFLDIALRMSLAQHMGGGESSACLYVDTPEGALDIAYEARAGDMFSRFVEAGDQIVMTANVNTSQLLRRMAKRCGRARMQLVRMTDWTTLSDVQVQENELFTEAYEAIEAALDHSGRPNATDA